MDKRIRITPAALAAIAAGDLENAIIAATPGGIEAQESAGQRSLVASTTLPRECGHGTSHSQLKKMGIAFGDIVDELFIEATLPTGWKKVATDHSMHSDLLDDRGRKRAGIFYKAAFYDRRADITLCQRFSTYTEPVGGYENPNYRTAPIHCVVTDCDKSIWSSDTIDPYPDDTSRDELTAWHNKEDALAESGKKWLDKNYPDWRNPLAYWD